MTSGAPSVLEVDATISRGGFACELAVAATAGRTLAVVGPNGAGKSTLIAAVAGLLPIERGVIRLGDRTLDDGGATLVPAERRGVGVVFQDFLLFPHLDVRDNVGFALRTRHGRARARADVEPWLERFGLTGLADRLPSQLSGGQQQRVALARALAAEPAALLLDEPMASLDVEVRDETRERMAATLRDFGGPTLLVTHDFADVEALASEVLVLEAGRVTQRGTPAALRAAPATPYAARLTRSDA